MERTKTIQMRSDRGGVDRCSRMLSVIVPTRNERDNIAPLVARVAASTRRLDAELLFVDDSDDETPEAVAQLVSCGPMPVRMVHRPAGVREGGLGGAVKVGLMSTDAEWVIVMDGDLQHPPELIPEMITAAITGDHDMVVASRYCRTGGSAGGLSSGTRRLVSSGATLVSRVLFPRLVGRVSDPMSGFFAIRRGAIDPWRLRPEGFKILLELLVRTPPRSIRELPFVFADRRCGISKASCREGARYVRQLVRLRCASWSGGPVSRGRQVVRLVASLWSFG